MGTEAALKFLIKLIDDGKERIWRNGFSHRADLVDAFLRAGLVVFQQVLHGAVALGVPGFLIPGVLGLHMVSIMLVVVHPLDFLKAEIRLLRVLPELMGGKAPVAVEIALEYTEKYAGELYISEAGHLEFTYSASASQALNMAFDAPIGKPFGFFCGSPAAIGLVMADLALKSSPVEIIKYMTPNRGTSHSNEIIAAVTGDASAVKNAVLTAREVGLQLLISMGSYPEVPGTPYL